METNVTQMASTILRNQQNDINTVETVVSYEFKKEDYWGKIDGVAIGLQTDVFEGPYSTGIEWGIKHSSTVVEV